MLPPLLHLVCPCLFLRLSSLRPIFGLFLLSLLKKSLNTKGNNFDWKDKGSCSLFSSAWLPSFANESVKEHLHILIFSPYSLDFSNFLSISRLFFPLFICQTFTSCLLFTINVLFSLPTICFNVLSPIPVLLFTIFFHPKPRVKWCGGWSADTYRFYILPLLMKGIRIEGLRDILSLYSLQWPQWT